MQLSETIKLYLSKEQRNLIVMTMMEYIDTVNNLVSDSLNGSCINKYTSADVNAMLPSALKNQCIRDAKSIVHTYKKRCRQTALKKKELEKLNSSITLKEPTVPVLKKLCCYINNQNFKLNGDCIEFPVLINNKSTRICVRTSMTQEQISTLKNSKLGTMRIVYKSNKIVAQIVYEVVEPQNTHDGNVMGVDLGIKCPAVSYTSDGKVKFYGNGRKNKYMRRRYAKRRKELQKEKHIDVVKRINDKEKRIMKDIDHKLSHDIVQTAVSHNVTTIKLERLSNIRSTTRTSRKNNHSLHTWSFYRLSKNIEYKAKLAGIRVEYVDPAYTSQKCPNCGRIHHANDRKYICDCGFQIHRDLLGAINICNSTEYVGDRNIRHTA